MKAVLIEIGGLRPGAPALALLRTLHGREGVLRAAVSEGARQVTVVYDPAVVTVDDLRALIERSGLHCISHVAVWSPYLESPYLESSTEGVTNPPADRLTVGAL